MRDALSALEMLPTDRAALRNLVIVILASTGAAVIIGTSCLGRGRARPDLSAGARDDSGSVRSSVGGVLPNGTTTITSGQMERGASPSGPPNGWPQPPQAGPQMQAVPAPAAAPMATPNPAPPATTFIAPPAIAPPAPPPLPPVGAGPNGNTTFRTPTQGLESGAGQFMSEPPPWAASNLVPNPEAGAGRFITEQR